MDSTALPPVIPSNLNHYWLSLYYCNMKWIFEMINWENKVMIFMLCTNTIPSIKIITYILGLSALLALKLNSVMRDEEGRWVCPECNLSTKSRTNIREHIESKHLPENCIQCPLCGNVCKSKAALRVHKIRYHKNEQQQYWTVLINLRVTFNFCCSFCRPRRIEETNDKASKRALSMSWLWL